MFKRLLFVCCLLIISSSFLVQDIHSAINPDFTPKWQVGDSWDTVMRRMSASIPRAPKTIEAGGYIEHPGEPEHIHFEVIEHKELDGEMCYVVEVTSQESVAEEILQLYIREGDFTLQQVVEITKDNSGEIIQTIDYHNENGHDFVMFTLLPFSISIPCDFPNFPPTNTNEERTIQVPDSAQTMTQKATFIDDNTLKIELSTKVSEGFYKTIQIWERGKPWWSSCKREFTYEDYETGEEKTEVQYDPVLEGTDTTPPDLAVSVSPATLWPPNHEMVEIAVTIEVSDDYDRFPEVKLESVTSNEPDDAPGGGDGHTTQDIQTTEVWDSEQHKMVDKISLRAERAGKGDGRIYTITYSATDFSGNTSTTSAIVTVPYDMGKQ